MKGKRGDRCIKVIPDYFHKEDTILPNIKTLTVTLKS